MKLPEAAMRDFQFSSMANPMLWYLMGATEGMRSEPEDHVEPVRGGRRIRQVAQEFRLVPDVLLDLEQVVLVAVPLHVVRKPGRFADLGERQEEAVRIHHERLETGLAVELGQERRQAALRVPSGGRAHAGVFLPRIEAVPERVEPDFRRDVGQHDVDEGRADRLDPPGLDEFAQQGEHFRRLLRHDLERAAGGFERDPVSAVAHEFEQRTVGVLAHPPPPRRVELGVLDVRVRHKDDPRFLRHGLTP